MQRIPNINYIGAGPIRKEVFQHILSYEGPKAIMGISRGIAILTELGVGLHEEARRSLRVALYGSGVLPPRKRVELRELYPNVEILSYFAATQAETIGLQLTSDGYLVGVVDFRVPSFDCCVEVELAIVGELNDHATGRAAP